MRKQTLISLIVTIVLFISAAVLIALGIKNAYTPVSYNFVHGFFSYHIRYFSMIPGEGSYIMFSLGRALLISSFVMLGFTLYFSAKKENKEEVKVHRSAKSDKEKAEDAEVKEEMSANSDSDIS